MIYLKGGKYVFKKKNYKALVNYTNLVIVRTKGVGSV